MKCLLLNILCKSIDLVSPLLSTYEFKKRYSQICSNHLVLVEWKQNLKW